MTRRRIGMDAIGHKGSTRRSRRLDPAALGAAIAELARIAAVEHARQQVIDDSGGSLPCSRTFAWSAYDGTQPRSASQ